MKNPVPLSIFINYPNYQFKIREPEWKKEEIWDDIRRQWVALTPEEWVRQNFLQYLVQVKKYPAPYIAVERKIKVGELNKRFDILVYNKAVKPWLMIECKSSDTPLEVKVLSQVLNYNMAVAVPYLVVTNGLSCFGYYRDGVGMSSIETLPDYE